MQVQKTGKLAALALPLLSLAAPLVHAQDAMAEADAGIAVPYMVGGVGKSEAAIMRREGRNFDLRVEFSARKDNEFVRDADLLVTDMSGAPVIALADAGPIVNVDLPRDGTSLRQLADQIDAGTVTGGRRFDLAVALTRTDLGTHHDMQAAEAWAHQDAQAAGRSLAAAARYARGALTTLDGKLAAGSAEALQGVEGFGERLASRTDSAVASEWVRARASVHAALDDVYRRLAVSRAG